MNHFFVGGEHFLPHAAPKELPKHSFGEFISGLGQKIELFGSGRDAFFGLLHHLEFRTIGLPDFLCESLFQPIKPAKKNIRWYRITNDLAADPRSLQQLGADDLLLIVQHFGHFDRVLYDLAAARNTRIVSDVTHSFFHPRRVRETADRSDVLLASLRKLGPFPDLGILAGNKSLIPASDPRLRSPFWALRLGALVGRAASRSGNFENPENVQAFELAEKMLDATDEFGFSSSLINRRLLKEMSYSGCVTSVRNNFSRLYDGFAGSTAVKPLLGEKTWSPYFPVLFPTEKSRDSWRLKLRRASVFCPVHWDTGFLPRRHFLSRHILSIPCDHRYGKKEMEHLLSQFSAKEVRHG